MADKLGCRRSGEFVPNQVLAELIRLIPESQRGRSGGAFYSGRAAWIGPSRIYLIGYNPGGDASGPGTVMEHTNTILEHDRYSAYVTEGNPVNEPHWGTSMQASVRNVLANLGYDPNLVPASNLFFARSSRADGHPDELKQRWKEECWAFHEHVIERLGIEVVMCIGKATADFVLSRDRFSDHRSTGTSFVSSRACAAPPRSTTARVCALSSLVIRLRLAGSELNVTRRPISRIGVHTRAPDGCGPP